MHSNIGNTLFMLIQYFELLLQFLSWLRFLFLWKQDLNVFSLKLGLHAFCKASQWLELAIFTGVLLPWDGHAVPSRAKWWMFCTWIQVSSRFPLPGALANDIRTYKKRSQWECVTLSTSLGRLSARDLFAAAANCMHLATSANIK